MEQIATANYDLEVLIAGAHVVTLGSDLGSVSVRVRGGRIIYGRTLLWACPKVAHNTVYPERSFLEIPIASR